MHPLPSLTMAGSTIGTLFRLTTFGESHGSAIGGIIDGFPAGFNIDLDAVNFEMQRRRPGQSSITSQRNETDWVEFLSGIKDGVTLGSPISFIIRNSDERSADYEAIKDVYRPSHADYTYEAKYGWRDERGGGRASARETAVRVAAGALAKQLLAVYGIHVAAYVSQVGHISLKRELGFLEIKNVDSHPVRCPDSETADAMQAYIEHQRESGDTCGGVISAAVTGIPAGLGEPVFDKLSATLAAACMSINAAHGFEYGSGFSGASMKGSDHNDVFVPGSNGKPLTLTNHSGGIQGGLSNGMELYFRVAFKPVSTLLRPQQTVNTSGEKVTIHPGGRHDPCVVPRAVPIVEAMAALVIADQLLRNTVSKKSNLDIIYRSSNT